MRKHTKGPLTVAVSDKWPFNIVTTDSAGNVVFSQPLPCYSTRHKNAAEAMSGKGLPPEWDAAEHNARTLADEVLRAAAPDLLKACQACADGVKGWQEMLHAAIAKATGADNA